MRSLMRFSLTAILLFSSVSPVLAEDNSSRSTAIELKDFNQNYQRSSINLRSSSRQQVTNVAENVSALVLEQLNSCRLELAVWKKAGQAPATLASLPKSVETPKPTPSCQSVQTITACGGVSFRTNNDGSVTIVQFRDVSAIKTCLGALQNEQRRLNALCYDSHINALFDKYNSEQEQARVLLEQRAAERAKASCPVPQLCEKVDFSGDSSNEQTVCLGKLKELILEEGYSNCKIIWDNFSTQKIAAEGARLDAQRKREEAARQAALLRRQQEEEAKRQAVLNSAANSAEIQKISGQLIRTMRGVELNLRPMNKDLYVSVGIIVTRAQNNNVWTDKVVSDYDVILEKIKATDLTLQAKPDPSKIAFEELKRTGDLQAALTLATDKAKEYMNNARGLYDSAVTLFKVWASNISYAISAKTK